MGKQKSTKYAGVYERESEKRLHNGKPDVCYYLVYRVDGNLKWEKCGWASEGCSAKLASQIRAERLRNIRFGKDLPQKRNTAFFKQVAERYLKWASVNKAKEGIDDKFLYTSHLAPRFDEKRMDQISPFDLEKMKIELSQKGLSPATVVHCLKLFRHMVNKAILWDMYKGENPITKVKLPKLNNERQRFLTHHEANLLLNELLMVSKQFHDIALLSLHCGLRAGEIFNLKMHDLDFQNGLINISDSKNNESRKAYMTKTVKKMLSDYFIGENLGEFIFKDRRGQQIKTVSDTFTRCVDRLRLNNGVTDPRQKVVFHTLRHTFASWLTIQGESLITLRDLLGHKSLRMTNRYAHLSPDHKKRAILKLEKNFKNKKKEGKVKLINY